MGAVFVVLMAVSGWWLVGWGNVRTLAKMVHDDDGESAEILCAASPVLMHHYQLELLEEIEKAGRALPIVGGAEPDVESDFIRILTLNDIFKKSRADEDGQTDEDEQ